MDRKNDGLRLMDGAGYKKIIIACDSYKGCLSSREVNEAIASGIKEWNADDAGLHPRGRRRRLRPFLGDLDRQGGPVQADGQGPPAGSQPPGPAPGRGAGSRHAEGLRPDHGPASWLNFLQFVKKGFSPAPEFVII